MKETLVRDLMVPLSEYATVTEEATLAEAVMALEEAQRKFDPTRHRHRAVLVLDSQKSGKVVIGKVSMFDVLRALEPRYRALEEPGMAARSGYSPGFLKSMIDQGLLWNQSLMSLCRKAAFLKVRDFMYTPSEGEYVKEDASLGEAVHQLVLGHHHSLLVLRGEEIAGVLRLTDVFQAICEAVKQCGVK